MTRSEHTQQLHKLMESNALTPDTRLYRSTLPEFLEPLGDGSFLLSANDDPSEAVVNVYEGGHMSLASQIGAGLAFAAGEDNQWRGEDRTTVAVRLRDVLDQGGLLYPVESVITEEVWYVTLPSGGVRVEVVGD